MSNYQRPGSSFHGPSWLRFGWSDQVNGWGHIVARVFTVTSGRVCIRVQLAKRKG